MRPDAQIINLNFSFSRDKVDALKLFPVGTEALACFNYYSSAHQAVNALYEAGVTNLNLYVNYPGNRNLNKKRDRPGHCLRPDRPGAGRGHTGL